MMQKDKGNKKTIELVRKPILTGSWHGADARRIAFKRFLSVLGTTAVYLFGSLLLGLDAMWGRVLMCVALVGGVTYYQYMNGLNQGENDSAYGEIIYGRRQNGYTVAPSDCERSFHPMKGVFAALAGSAPFVLFALVFAFITEPVYYSLGVLPSWTDGLMSQTEFSSGLAYYSSSAGISAMDWMRIADRAMIMPFINIASPIGAQAVLLAERLSPLLVLISPMGYAYGYLRGRHLRDLINTGIKVGDERKKKREQKARRKRQRQQAQKRTKGPEQLV